MSNQIGKISAKSDSVGKFAAAATNAVEENWATSLTPVPVMAWNPHPDITAHELALAMNVLLSKDNWFAFYKSLPENVQRHFEVRQL